MISTVTVSTVSTVTTAAIAGSVELIGVLVLFALLLQKEVTTTSSNRLLRRLGQILNVGIFPLSIAFLLVVISQAIGFMR